jgi:hypothetical protein
MYSVYAITNNNNEQFFVLDEKKEDIIETIHNILRNNRNKKIQYHITEATENDINRYGGIADIDIFEYVIEKCCLLHDEDQCIR